MIALHYIDNIIAELISCYTEIKCDKLTFHTGPNRLYMRREDWQI